MSAALCALHEVCSRDCRPFKNLVPSFVSILKQVSCMICRIGQVSATPDAADAAQSYYEGGAMASMPVAPLLQLQ